MTGTDSPILGADGRPMKRVERAATEAALTGEVAAPSLFGVRRVWQEAIARDLTPARLAGLLRRAAEGKKVWQAHREHFYQKATQRGRTHAQVVRAVLAANAALVALATASLHLGWTTVPAGAAVVLLLLANLARAKRVAA